ncbi:hypothetical protein P3T27_004755 [Kitasatospora sp. MAA19]|uniref:hypothetical protein n=1 Tax=Kitasatospora sp. MAA19 TaxID=3035090 RepID=UPI0024736979|nr:hypothetical protein [Kitasatospora sp. MAA19]MDH6708018.1 hypothetical protein [Kitasatospora sp. MAA19]
MASWAFHQLRAVAGGDALPTGQAVAVRHPRDSDGIPFEGERPVGGLVAVHPALQVARVAAAHQPLHRPQLVLADRQLAQRLPQDVQSLQRRRGDRLQAAVHRNGQVVIDQRGSSSAQAG